MTQTPTAPPTPAATAGPVLVVGAGLLGASIGHGLGGGRGVLQPEVHAEVAKLQAEHGEHADH